MEKARALVNVRDINLVCQHYKTYAQIEGRATRRKITRARRRNGVLEVRTAARDEWVQPVTWIEWINDIDVSIRYMARDIR
jgi:malate synthase